MPASRSSRATLSEAIPPAPLDDMIDDTTGAEEHLPLSASASVSAPPIVTMEQVVNGAAADSQAMINPPNPISCRPLSSKSRIPKETSSQRREHSNGRTRSQASGRGLKT